MQRRLQQSRRPLRALSPASHDNGPAFAEVLEVDVGFVGLDVSQESSPDQHVLRHHVVGLEGTLSGADCLYP